MGDQAERSQDAKPQHRRAYPIEATLVDGTRVTIRPIGPQDAEREQAFVRGLSPESRYFRFMSTLRELSPEMLEHFTHPNPSREVALVALVHEDDMARQIGVARCALGLPVDRCEFAIVVGDAYQSKSLGSRLTQELIACARSRGVPRMEGSVLASNRRTPALIQTLGFAFATAAEDPRMRRLVKSLN